jgi:hypothetical protein
MRWHGCLRAALIGGVAVALSGVSANAADQPAKRTIGLALYYASFAMYETPDAKEECPNGFHLSNKENWALRFPSEEEQNAFIEARVHLGPGGYAGNNTPVDFFQARGPEGQLVASNPWLFKDEPLREVQSKVAYGLNLDGTTDGRATANTCKHQKFAAADGSSVAVDNQLYRVYGCVSGWRKGGTVSERRRREVREQILNRLLFVISDVDDERNDPDVTVTTYKGIDRIDVDAVGKPIVGSQQRIDVRFKKYTTRTRGKIVDGVLTTDPIDQYMPMLNTQEVSERLVQGRRLQLKLTPTGAEGYLAGYENLKDWWNSYTKSYNRHTDSASPWSPPAMYEAAHRLADGYPDPKTGQCTAISAAYDVQMVRANIVSPRPDDPLVTNVSFKAAQRLVQSPGS